MQSPARDSMVTSSYSVHGLFQGSDEEEGEGEGDEEADDGSDNAKAKEKQDVASDFVAQWVRTVNNQVGGSDRHSANVQELFALWWSYIISKKFERPDPL